MRHEKYVDSLFNDAVKRLDKGENIDLYNFVKLLKLSLNASALQSGYSVKQACKLLNMSRGSYNHMVRPCVQDPKEIEVAAAAIIKYVNKKECITLAEFKEFARKKLQVFPYKAHVALNHAVNSGRIIKKYEQVFCDDTMKFKQVTRLRKLPVNQQ
jgi:hypothetical protein